MAETLLQPEALTLRDIYKPPRVGYLGHAIPPGHAAKRGYTDASVMAADALQHSPLLDAEVAELIGHEADTVRKVREDAAYRAKLVQLLEEKLQKLVEAGRLPDRVLADSNKGATIAGYPYSMGSREYAIVLALSMLDGTFHGELSPPGDEIEYDTTGVAIVGQHRGAAVQLLIRDDKG